MFLPVLKPTALIATKLIIKQISYLGELFCVTVDFSTVTQKN